MMQDLQAYFRNKKIKFTSICDTHGPKKFEKMIKLEESTKKSAEFRLSPSENPWDPDVREKENVLKALNAVNISENFNNFSTTMRNSSPYWFIGIGFILGSATTLIGIYVWFSTAMTCRLLRIQRRNPVESRDVTSQRVSLLQNLHGTSESPICPGTPPPPYREVMLHRNLYPSAQRN